MKRAPEPIVHFDGLYTRMAWRSEMATKRMERAMVKCLGPLWRKALYPGKHPLEQRVQAT